MAEQMNDTDSFDICIIGAGVIGLAIAYALARKFEQQKLDILVLEQEASFGQHISSRNSEVIHAGIYYPANSLKAKLCVRGKELLYQHCEQFQVPYREIGKLIVGRENELEALLELQENAKNNGVFDLQLMDKAQTGKIEPALTADVALFSPSTGIIDSHSYMQSLLHLAQNRGVHFSPYSRVEGIAVKASGFLVRCLLDGAKNQEQYQFRCRHLINSAGLQAQSVANSIDAVPKEIIPALYYCKGDYFEYRSKNPFSHLVYPLPDPNTAGLGIHATMDLSSQLRFGPDSDYVSSLDYEVSADKAALFAEKIASYFPSITADKLKPAYAGIRPKLAGPGDPAADFMIQGYSEHHLPGLIQLFGIESPGLTASLAIAEKVAGSVIDL